MQNKKKDYYTASEAAILMGVFPTYILQLIYAGKLKATKKGNRWRVDRQSAEGYAARLKARREGVEAGEEAQAEVA